MEKGTKQILKGICYFCGTVVSAVSMSFFAKKAKEHVGDTSINVARWIGESVGETIVRKTEFSQNANIPKSPYYGRPDQGSPFY
jgi:hypothetical protein